MDAKQSLDGLDKNFFKGLKKELQPGDSVEFYGEEGCGKTEVLTHFCISCILPKKWNSLDLFGKEAKVVFIDTAYKFPLWRLIGVLEKRVRYEASKKSMFISTADMSEIVRTCLQRLFLVRCTSSLILVKTLSHLEKLFYENPDICLLVIDTISEFYWMDRTINGTTRYQQEGLQRCIISKIKKLQEEFHLLVFVAKSALMNQTVSSSKIPKDSWDPSDYLSPEWNKFLTYKFILEKGLADLCDKSSNFFIASLTNKPNPYSCKFIVTDSGIQFI